MERITSTGTVWGAFEHPAARQHADFGAFGWRSVLTDRHALYSTKEFKKVRVRYFTDEEMKWEPEH